MDCRRTPGLQYEDSPKSHSFSCALSALSVSRKFSGLMSLRAWSVCCHVLQTGPIPGGTAGCTGVGACGTSEVQRALHGWNMVL